MSNFRIEQRKRQGGSQKQQNQIADASIRVIMRLQALWRGYITRKYYQTVAKIVNKDKWLIIQQGKSKYFTKNEFWETISKTSIYDPEKPRQKMTYKYQCSGAVYEGDFKGGFRDGFGIMKWKDGATYEGQWKDNHAFGQGKFTHASGDVYEGQWMRDRANGYGEYKSADGGIYQGQWLNDKQHGKGQEFWPDKSSFEGSYVDGLKSGYGYYKWANGSTYRGLWENNMINGAGKQQWFDGRIYEGEFKDNLMSGFGFYTFSDGKTYEGYYKSDKKHGYGIYTWLDGKRYSGWWNDGKQHGYGMLIKGSKIQIGVWQDGKKLEWLTDDKIDQLDKEREVLLKRSHSVDQDRINELTYDRPSEFDQTSADVKKRVDKILKQYQ